MEIEFCFQTMTSFLSFSSLCAAGGGELVSSPLSTELLLVWRGRPVGPLQVKHKQEGGCSPGLGWTHSHSEPPGARKEDDNLSPSMAPFTACLIAMALRVRWARWDQATHTSICVCSLFSQHCGRPEPSGQC